MAVVDGGCSQAKTRHLLGHGEPWTAEALLTSFAPIACLSAMRLDDPLLVDWLARAGLAEQASRLAPYVRAEIRIEATPVSLGDLPLGASRIGGLPDLPSDFPWPHHRWPRAEVDAWPEPARQELEQALAAGQVTIGTFDGVEHVAMPLVFVAQLALIEVAPHDREGLLPVDGFLWFFVSPSTMLPDPDGLATLAAAVVHLPGTPRLQRRTAPPMPDGEPLTPTALRFVASPVLNEDTINNAPPGLEPVEVDRLLELARTSEQPWPRHAVLPVPDQGALGSLPPEGWQALLRLDSAEQPRMNWGDSAWLTFGLPSEALEARRFGETRAFVWVG